MSGRAKEWKRKPMLVLKWIHSAIQSEDFVLIRKCRDQQVKTNRKKRVGGKEERGFEPQYEKYLKRIRENQEILVNFSKI